MPRERSIGGESHKEIESLPALHPANCGFQSNRLTEEQTTREAAEHLQRLFSSKLINSDGHSYSELPPEQRPERIHFLEKTPKNALRIPFLNSLYPDARFIFLHRNPRENISSIMEAWRSGMFVTYPDLPGWNGLPWSLLLTAGWNGLDGMPLEEVAAFQWQSANLQILDDLADLPDKRWCTVGYEQFLSDQAAHLQRLCNFMGVPFGSRMQAVAAGKLPNSRYTLTPPDPDKWRINEQQVMSVLPQVEATALQIRKLSH